MRWGANAYVYSVVAHIRTVLAALVQVAEAENAAAAYILSRHIFEWTAHACYIYRNLKNYFSRSQWERAWGLLTAAATGNLWAKQHGAKYATPGAPNLSTLPDPVAVSNLVNAYEKYEEQHHGSGDAKDSYSLLSEYSHPNAAALMQYHVYQGWVLAFSASNAPSPLPIVNWCLIDLLRFLDEILQLTGDSALRPGIVSVLKSIAARAPTSRP